MIFNQNSLLYITLLLFFLNISEALSQEAIYRYDTVERSTELTLDKKADVSFYLIGDAGYSAADTLSEALLALQQKLKIKGKADDYVIFLGNNVPPSGKDSDKNLIVSLNKQVEAVKGFKGNIVFLPGNNDWKKGGVKALRKQQKYLEEQLKIKDALKPKGGCPLQFVDISEDTQLIIIDSQWFITDWDNQPLINDDCSEIKTREAMLTELETEFKKNQNKTTLVAMHHPLYSNGVHGGTWGVNKNGGINLLQPIANFFRTSGALSRQDIQNGNYQTLVNRVKIIAAKWGKTIFVGGHENSLQYIEDAHIKQIISGAGAKSSYAKLGNNGLFAYPGQGFAKVDIFKDGSSWVRFYKSDNGIPKLLYSKEIFSPTNELNKSALPETFQKRKNISIYGSKENERTGFYKSLWGDRYRDLYDKEINIPIADLDTLYGGLTPVREGGGHQTKSLRVKDSLDREYNFRMLRKNAIQFIQSVAFKEKLVSEDFENTFPEDMIQDFYTGSHPYAFLAVPKLAEAGGIAHTNPKLFYLPKQKKMGKYNETQGGELYMLEERPEEHWLDYKSFASANHDIQSTEGMFDRLRRDEKYSVDEKAFIRARLFDMLIGDWDRHNDQWRWAELEDENGDHLFKPIPRDRDQVFSNFDGLLFDNLRGIVGFVNQFGKYDENIKNLKWFNKSAVNLDRNLLQNSGREDWMAQAEFLQENITNEVIEEAFNALPEEIQGSTTQDLVEKLKARRDNLSSIAQRYYKYLAKYTILTGTDKDDFIDIIREDNGKTKVTISRNKDGNRDEIVHQRKYSSKETDEIWIYGLDDDDEFYEEGNGSKKIKIRLIGGQNNDSYSLENDKNINIYDHASKKNTVEQENKAHTIFTDNYDVNVYDYNKKISSSNALLPSLGYNPDNGLILGFSNTYVVNRFITNPFTAKHVISGNYFFDTQGFELSYTGVFADAVGDYNILIGGHFSSPKNTKNFFGYGNETINYEDEYSKDYNRVRIKSIGGKVGLEKESDYGNTINFLASFEGNKVEATPNRFITDVLNVDEKFYTSKYFVGLESNYNYQSYDDVLNPTRGLKAALTIGGKLNTKTIKNKYGYIKPYLELYNPISKGRKWVLNTRAMGQINIGNNYEFYQAATVGQNTGMRGYRLERFTGKQAFAAGTDIRYSFNKIKTSLIPIQIGIFGGFDTGRVWNPEFESKKWHNSYGGGIWITGAKALRGKINLFNGEDGLRLSAEVVFGL